MKSISDRSYSTILAHRPYPETLWPDPAGQAPVMWQVNYACGESPEALRGYLHGIDQALTAISVGVAAEQVDEQTALDIIGALMTLVFYIEHSDEYAAAVAILDR